jgi:uncharacterized membrane protein
MTNILKYFFQGLLVFIPIGITVLLFFKLFQFFESLFSFAGFTSSSVLNTLISVAILIVFIILLGLLASSFVFKQLFSFLEEKLEHMPLIKHIYSPIKDFMNAFMGNKKRFTKPVLVLTNPLVNIQEIGFITQDDLSEWDIKDKIAVYLPLSYSLSGKLIIVPKEFVSPLNADGSEAMKFIVSGGVTDVDKD